MAFLERQRSGEHPGDEPAELAALADGSLDPERRAALLGRVAASEELAQRLALQQRALDLTGAAAAEVEAPAALRARIRAQRQQRGAPVRRGTLFAGAATVAAVVALAVVLTRPETHGERLAVALAPTGHATLARTGSGWRIELRAPQLRRLDGGRFYEAWLKAPSGVLVPVGTFNDGRRVTLWAGVSPRRFTTLTVTRERADGDQRSSGERVLTGTVSARR